jgi:hypothetical protein
MADVNDYLTAGPEIIQDFDSFLAAFRKEGDSWLSPEAMRRFENMAVLATVLKLPEHPFMTAMNVPGKLQDPQFCEKLLEVVQKMKERLTARERVEGNQPLSPETSCGRPRRTA